MWKIKNIKDIKKKYYFTIEEFFSILLLAVDSLIDSLST